MKPPASDPAGTGPLALSALAASLFASVCCILPLVVGLLGVGVGLVGSLAVLEKFRPVFIVLTLALLGFAFYRLYRPAEKCGPDEACAVADSATRRRSRILLWCIAILAVAALLLPYYLPYLVD